MRKPFSETLIKLFKGEKKKTKIKVATKRGFVAKRERQVEKQRGPCCLVWWKVLTFEGFWFQIAIVI